MDTSLKNPFHFQDFGISEACLVVNGRREPPELYRVNKDGDDKADLYSSFLENVGVGMDDRDCGITYDDYYGGSFLLVWDRTQDKCNRFHRHDMGIGNLDLNIKLAEETSKTMKILIYTTFSNDMIIDKDANIHIDT